MLCRGLQRLLGPAAQLRRTVQATVAQSQVSAVKISHIVVDAVHDHSEHKMETQAASAA